MNKTVAKKILYETLGSSWDRGTELLFKCPSCNHHKRKFSINLDKNVFKCWVCDYYGRNIRRVIRRFGSYTQLQKWDQITDRTDISRFAELFMDEQSGEDEAKIELPKEFVSLANKNLPLSANRALRYLKERGITKEQIVRWKIGFCYDGEYGGRIIVPSFGTSGYPNYFIARSYVGHRMKYKNPQASKNVVFNDLFTNWNNDLVIVEELTQETLCLSWGLHYAQTPTYYERLYEMTPRATSPSILTRLKKSGASFKRFCATMWNSTRSM
jgi:hypothetical protein